MDDLDALIDEAERNGGRARSIAPPISRSTRNHENTPAVRNRFNGDTSLSPSLRRGLDSQNAQTIDSLYELERLNRLCKQAKEYKKNKEEDVRRNHMLRKQRMLERRSINPLKMPRFRKGLIRGLPQGIIHTANYLSSITGLEPLGIVYAILGTVSIATWGRVAIKLTEEVVPFVRTGNSGSLACLFPH